VPTDDWSPQKESDLFEATAKALKEYNEASLEHLKACQLHNDLGPGNPDGARAMDDARQRAIAALRRFSASVNAYADFVYPRPGKKKRNNKIAIISNRPASQK